MKRPEDNVHCQQEGHTDHPRRRNYKSEQSCSKGKGVVSKEIDFDEEGNSSDQSIEEKVSVDVEFDEEEDSKDETRV